MKPECQTSVDALIELAIREDIGDGDHTLQACCIPATEKAACACSANRRVFSRHRNRTTGASTPGPRHAIRTDPPRRRPREAADVASLRSGTAPVPAASRTHPAEHHAAHERRGDPDVAYANKIKDLHTKSRHANHPGHARIDKMAVKIGGGENHRMGLFNMILLKDNHIDFAGIRPAT